MRRIRNITNEALDVPILGVIIEPGDVANVPDGLEVEFSSALFEVDEASDDKTPPVPKTQAGTYAAPAEVRGSDQ